MQFLDPVVRCFPSKLSERPGKEDSFLSFRHLLSSQFSIDGDDDDDDDADDDEEYRGCNRQGDGMD